MPVSLLFFSSSPIAVPLFETLLKDDRFEVRGLFCQPDRPAGRGQKVLESKIKSLALERQIPVYQPEKLRVETDLLNELQKNPPDFLLTFSYGQILNEPWLALAKIAPLNIHPSLLPLYRGPTPIPAALLHGDSETGISLMKMVPEMDAGPIAFQHRLVIPKEISAGNLFEMISLRAAEWIPDDLLKLVREPVFLDQDASNVSFCSLLGKEDGFVDFQTSAEELLRRYQAYSPWPGLWTRWKGQRLKLFDVSLPRGLKPVVLKSGALHLEEDKLFIGTNSGLIEVGSVQLEGKKKVSVPAFLQGQLDFLDAVLPS